MSPMIALAVVAALVVLGVGLGVLSRRRATRVREVTGNAAVDLAPLRAAAHGVREVPVEVSAQVDREGPVDAVIVQFSTAYCARCPGTSRLITEIVAERPGVEFLHVDVTERPDLVSEYQLTQTPTVLLLDRTHVARTRLSGELKREVISRELDAARGGPA